jgi:hypothetical protein
MNTENSKKLKRPKAWKHTQPITPARLKQMRDEFWDTAPHYGGQKGTGFSCLCQVEQNQFLCGCVCARARALHGPRDVGWFRHLLCFDIVS